jgi:DNA-binding transcriptional MocR family regulator
VSFAPGSSFFLQHSDRERYMRLNFAAQPLELIEEGTKRLGRTIRRLAALPDAAQRA